EIPLAAARGIVEGRIARHHTDVRLAGGAGGAAEGAGRANLAAAGGVARRARAVLHAAAAVAERGMASAQLREAAAERPGLTHARADRVGAAAAVAGGAIIATELAAERRVVEVTHAAVEAGAAVALRVLAGGRRIDAAALLRGATETDAFVTGVRAARTIRGAALSALALGTLCVGGTIEQVQEGLVRRPVGTAHRVDLRLAVVRLVAMGGIGEGPRDRQDEAVGRSGAVQDLPATGVVQAGGELAAALLTAAGEARVGRIRLAAEGAGVRSRFGSGFRATVGAAVRRVLRLAHALGLCRRALLAQAARQDVAAPVALVAFGAARVGIPGVEEAARRELVLVRRRVGAPGGADAAVVGRVAAVAAVGVAALVAADGVDGVEGAVGLQTEQAGTAQADPERHRQEAGRAQREHQEAHHHHSPKSLSPAVPAPTRGSKRTAVVRLCGRGAVAVLDGAVAKRTMPPISAAAPRPIVTVAMVA